MSDTAGVQVNRIVALVAELSRRAEEGREDATLGDLAARYGTTPAQIRHDVVALTAASEGAGTDWLSSIAIQQEGDRFSVTSRGAFRRPVRLTAPELTAIQIGLVTESDPPPPLSRAFAALLGEQDTPDAGPPALRPVPPASDSEAHLLRLAREAIDTRRVLLIRYAGARDRVGIDRPIELHDIVYQEGHYYLVAFCRRADDWRNFRVDRVLDGALTNESFAPRPYVPTTLESRTVFRAGQELDAVDVRFAPSIARWIRERYPDARPADGGGVVVTYQVSDPQWLVRTVLQYGAEAEVVGPEEYRDVMRASLAKG